MSRPLDPAWESGTWEGAERDALRAGAALSFREKIRWNEEAEQLGLLFAAQSRRRGLPVDPRLRELLEPAPPSS